MSQFLRTAVGTVPVLLVPIGIQSRTGHEFGTQRGPTESALSVRFGVIGRARTVTFSLGAQKHLPIFGAFGLDFTMQALATPTCLKFKVVRAIHRLNISRERNAITDTGLAIVVEFANHIRFLRTGCQLNRFGIHMA